MIPKGTKAKGYFKCECNRKFPKTRKGERRFNAHREDCKSVSFVERKAWEEKFEKMLKESENG